MKFRQNTSAITKRLTAIAIICLAAVLAMPAAAQRRKAAKPKARPTLEALFDTADQALVMYDTEALSDAIDEISDRLDAARKPSEADTERLSQLLAEGKNLNSDQLLTPKGVRMTVTMITVIPVLCIYPFLQRYFVKGIMIGAVKG